MVLSKGLVKNILISRGFVVTKLIVYRNPIPLSALVIVFGVTKISNYIIKTVRHMVAIIKKKPTSFSALIKASKKFELFRVNLATEQEQAGAIQAFEYCFELAKKSVQKVIKKKTGVEPYGSRDIFREAARAGLINDPEVWFKFIDSRNLTSHTYEEDVAFEVIALFPLFSEELQKLIIKLEHFEGN